MINGINRVQPNNIFKVNPVQLFDNNRQNRTENNPFNSGLFAQQTNETFNLNHPRTAGGAQANNLDLLA